jgi:hypothetical protein
MHMHMCNEVVGRHMMLGRSDESEMSEFRTGSICDEMEIGLNASAPISSPSAIANTDVMGGIVMVSSLVGVDDTISLGRGSGKPIDKAKKRKQ